jgi:predicted transcriptional regulator
MSASKWTIDGIPHQLYKKYRRALSVLRIQETTWLRVHVSRLIKEAEDQNRNEIDKIITRSEKLILDCIEDGCYTIEDISKESQFNKKEVHQIIQRLIEAGFIEKRTKGGKTEEARGAQSALYVLTSAYHSLFFNPNRH